LISLLDETVVDVQLYAIDALGKMGPAAKNAVTALQKKLEDPKIKIRQGVTKTLGNLGREANSAAPALIKVVNGGAKELRREAIISLGKIGHAGVTIKTLVTALDDADTDICECALAALKNLLGTLTKEDVESLAPLLKSRKVEVRNVLIEALVKIDRCKKSLEILVAACDDDNAEASQSALTAFNSFLGAVTKDDIDILSPALKSKRVEVREVTIDALLKAGNAAANKLGEAWLSEADSKLREKIANGLEKMGSDAKNAVPALRLGLKEPDRRLQAMKILGAIRTVDDEVVDDLVKIITEEKGDVNESVLEALVKIGRIDVLINCLDRDKTNRLTKPTRLTILVRLAALEECKKRVDEIEKLVSDILNPKISTTDTAIHAKKARDAIQRIREP
jgi:HEAT repeat protein